LNSIVNELCLPPPPPHTHTHIKEGKVDYKFSVDAPYTYPPSEPVWHNHVIFSMQY